MPPHMLKEDELADPCTPDDEDDLGPITPSVLDYYSHMSLEAPGLPPKSFRVGILATSLESVGSHIFAMSNPASPCVVVAVATLDSTDPNVIEEWCRTHELCPKNREVVVRSGAVGFGQIIECSDVNAVYLALPFEERNGYVTSALESGKHVLVDYPIAEKTSDMILLLKTAQGRGLNLFESSKFLHHHRVKEFLGRILDQGAFQGIKSITTSLNVRQDFLDKNVQESNPNWHSQGCIGTLARYCVMFGVLLFHRVNCRPISVQVTKVKKDDSGLPYEAVCRVDFEKGCCLLVDCSYINTISVRQHVEVDAETRSASMINFVFPHHSLASYLLYEKDASVGKNGIKQGECIDMAGGPPGNVMMWRKFAELSRTMESVTNGGKGDYQQCVRDIGELSFIQVESHEIVLALMRSIEQDGAEVNLDPIDFPESWQ